MRWPRGVQQRAVNFPDRFPFSLRHCAARLDDSRRNLGIYGPAACGFSFSAERHTIRNLRFPFLARGNDDDDDHDEEEDDDAIPM